MINNKILNFILKLNTSKISTSRLKILDLLIREVRINLNKSISYFVVLYALIIQEEVSFLKFGVLLLLLL